jgi:hypothetical protein
VPFLLIYKVGLLECKSFGACFRRYSGLYFAII